MAVSIVCARDVAQILWAMSETDACAGLRKILIAIAEQYGPDIAAEFADQVVAEVRALPQQVAH